MIIGGISVVGGTPVQNPDSLKWYIWIPRDGNIDPDTGLPVIVGQWVEVPSPHVSRQDADCPVVACCPTSPWTYSSH